MTALESEKYSHSVYISDYKYQGIIIAFKLRCVIQLTFSKQNVSGVRFRHPQISRLGHYCEADINLNHMV